ncbi:undecaprenyldiphospho-muramoylpentapeptide beta-N-acetylglucosaminyltransferase [Caproiciproducens sp. NJN-50]|uniref:undecaprenyldiphospho-muramoylpentapeptide beta-N-acetylglucosaminyltransferase n=1 Tax=Acutalibacteraceae TaxID=3082771 RepID=UPI000FFE2366|nr:MULTISPECIES: undecaprenyldiphospho-muramoylpentapeptide beta-N-acetylglucosaminyltransferase [Acutalibacteraceae]QAT50143.1 undecaprenyldiphospho-muramoylpentapeptide beta-N-acetylglucosaminyltransferase [Caproiciproducens sp. NJN-50]
MKVLFAGGGTAGHINPALAIAGYIKEREPDAGILYVGAKGGMEERLVPSAGYEFRSITISGFQRSLSVKNLVRNGKTVIHLFTSTLEARRIIRGFLPDICVGTGGYVAGPVVREAIRMGIPSVIHEQNAYPGVTNKMLSKKADRTMLAVADAQKYLSPSARCVLTGNPVRQEVVRADRKAAREKLGLDSRPLILSFGGSLGARKINEAAADLLVQSAKSGRFQHIHGYGQWGKWFPGLLKEKGLELKDHKELDVREYISDMPDCLAAADLVICRAGAITLSELQAVGRASILIPSPNVAENHQFHNAMAMVGRGAAEIIEEKNLTGEFLCRKVQELFSQPGKIETLAENAKKMAIPDSCERIYRLIKEVLDRSPLD